MHEETVNKIFDKRHENERTGDSSGNLDCPRTSRLWKELQKIFHEVLFSFQDSFNRL